MDQESWTETINELDSVAKILMQVRDEFFDVPALKEYADILLESRDTIVRVNRRLQAEEAQAWAGEVMHTLGIDKFNETLDEEEEHATEAPKTEGEQPKPADDPKYRYRSANKVVRDARIEADLTTHELAYRAGVHHLTIENIESGKTQYPTPGTLEKLDRALGTNHLKDYAWHG